jgi:hypothetical protein
MSRTSPGVRPYQTHRTLSLRGVIDPSCVLAKRRNGGKPHARDDSRDERDVHDYIREYGALHRRVGEIGILETLHDGELEHADNGDPAQTSVQRSPATSTYLQQPRRKKSNNRNPRFPPRMQPPYLRHNTQGQKPVREAINHSHRNPNTLPLLTICRSAIPWLWKSTLPQHRRERE